MQPTTIRFLHVPTATLARELEGDAQVTIEAEYGSYVMEGTLYTAAHHQPVGSAFAGRHLPGMKDTGMPSPCNDGNIPVLQDCGLLTRVCLSHLDLDSIGGALRTTSEFQPLFVPPSEDLGRPGHLVYRQEFWELAERIDVSGAHRLDPGEPWAKELHAVWAWIDANRPDTSKTEVEDITEFVRLAGVMLSNLLEVDILDTAMPRPPRSHKKTLIEAGEERQKNSEKLNRDSLAEVRSTPRGHRIFIRHS